MNYYQALVRARDEKRKSEPEPKFTKGVWLPQVMTGAHVAGMGWDPVEVLREGVRKWHRFSWSDVLKVAEVVGWEKWILELERRQKAGIQDAANRYREQQGVTGSDLDSVTMVSVTGITGIGFDYATIIEHTDEREVGMQRGCPIVQGIRDFGYEDHPLVEDMMLWCDTYDNMEVRATSSDIWFTHTHCLGRGDKYCRFCIDSRDVLPGENYYGTLSRLRDVKRQEAEEEAGGDVGNLWAPAFAVLKKLESAGLSQEQQLRMGNQIQARIAVSTILIGSELIGWERFINGMIEKQIPKIREMARNVGTKWGITGTTARDGAVLMNIGMSGMGFDDHQIVRWSRNRVEGVARTCPIVDLARQSGLEDRLEGISLWCSAWHTADAGAMNRTVSCTFTHCLGRGDKLCRWIVESDEPEEKVVRIVREPPVAEKVPA